MLPPSLRVLFTSPTSALTARPDFADTYPAAPGREPRSQVSCGIHAGAVM